MKAERTRLKRLQRLERVRDIAKQTAAAEAAQAESTLSQLEGLAGRTRPLAFRLCRGAWPRPDRRRPPEWVATR